MTPRRTIFTMLIVGLLEMHALAQCPAPDAEGLGLIRQIEGRYIGESFL